MTRPKPKLKARHIPLLATIAVFGLLYAAASFYFPYFFTLRVFVNLFIDNAFLGIVAVGMTFAILSGGIDLSVGSVVACTGIVMSKLVTQHGFDPFLAIALVLVAGTAFGAAMGFFIAFYDLPPFIVTLAGMFLARGASQIISLESIPLKSPVLAAITNFGIPLSSRVNFPFIAIVLVAAVAAGTWIAQYTKFGRAIYAIGGNEQSALMMGLPVRGTKIGIYALSGFFATLGGVVYTLYTFSGYSLSGIGLELDAIASVVIGGTLLSGGVGYLPGTLLGVLIQGVIQTFISFEGTLNSWWTKIIIGALLFVFILLQTWIAGSARFRRRRKRENAADR
ncbi:MAG: sugar ABC transporter permease YjfF [Synergistaceae bacterium]|jgi:simple sugar transport system permease protein|nr:sugar ABC transporter permease YjfF [Synergistaceae bacterium]